MPGSAIPLCIDFQYLVVIMSFEVNRQKISNRSDLFEHFFILDNNPSFGGLYFLTKFEVVISIFIVIVDGKRIQPNPKGLFLGYE